MYIENSFTTTFIMGCGGGLKSPIHERNKTFNMYIEVHNIFKDRINTLFSNWIKNFQISISK